MGIEHEVSPEHFSENQIVLIYELCIGLYLLANLLETQKLRVESPKTEL